MKKNNWEAGLLLIFCVVKHNVKRRRRWGTDWEKILAKDTSYKVVIQNIQRILKIPQYENKQLD